MLRVGIIGTGHLGKIHLKLLQSNSRVSISGFFDIDPVQTVQTQKSFQEKSYSSFDELIENSDALIISCPTPFHHQYALQCLKNGKHLFIEKPLAATVKEAEEIATLEKETGLIVQTGHVERFNPAFKAAKPFIKQPMFIEGHRLAQFNPRGTDVSVIHDLMIHDIDIILSVVPSTVKAIHASGVAVVSDSLDIANARIEFENGCVANLTSSRMSMKNMRKARFFQPDAYISVDFLDKKAGILELHEVSGTPDPLSIVIDLGEKGQKLIYMQNPEIKESNAILEEQQEFVSAILDYKPVTINALAGLSAVRIANLIAENIQKTSHLNFTNV